MIIIRTGSLQWLYELAVNAKNSGGASAHDADNVVFVVVDFVRRVADGQIQRFDAVRHRYTAVDLPQPNTAIVIDRPNRVKTTDRLMRWLQQ